MMLFKKILRLIILVLCICSVTFSAFAVDQVAKEEISPPGDDGPLTAEQLPPINSTTHPPGGVGPQQPPAGLPVQPGQPANQVAPSQQ